MKLPVRVRHTRPSPGDLMQLVHIHPVTCKSNTKDRFLLCLLNDDYRPTGFAFSAYEGSHADLPHGDHYYGVCLADTQRPFSKTLPKKFSPFEVIAASPRSSGEISDNFQNTKSPEREKNHVPHVVKSTKPCTYKTNLELGSAHSYVLVRLCNNPCVFLDKPQFAAVSYYVRFRYTEV